MRFRSKDWILGIDEDTRPRRLLIVYQPHPYATLHEVAALSHNF